MNQPLRVELASWLIPAEAYQIFQSSFDPVPSVAPQAAKIPTSLVDAEALDAKILKSGAERQAVASYISNKYKIAHSASLEFVDKAMTVSREVGLDPTLILAVTAVESVRRFNLALLGREPPSKTIQSLLEPNWIICRRHWFTSVHAGQHQTLCCGWQ